MSTIPVNKSPTNGNVTSSSIPLRKNVSRQVSLPSKIPVNNPEAYRWKQKYEEVEDKRRTILSEREKFYRNLNELQKKHTDLLVKHECLETELFEKNEEFTKLTIASKNLYREYETLKNQYETETGAWSIALKDATQWYKENKELKRKTLLLDHDTVDNSEPTSDADLENLNKTIKQLSSEVAELTTEVDSLKTAEFQTSELNAKLSEDLDSEKDKNKRLEHELEILRNEHEQILRVSEMMRKQLQELKETEENQRNNVVTLRQEANDYKRERNVLAHQSTLLLKGFNDPNGNDSMMLLEEIETLKRSLEDERNKHEQELNSLQEKLEEEQSNSHVEVLEERLKLVECELQEALERAEIAEQLLKTPPAPPPPPPPPMLPPMLPPEPPVVPLRKRRSKINVQDIAATIGVTENTENKKPAVGVNEDIINAIKEGKFTLKKAKSEKSEKDTPKAVSEILNILGSLRRAPKKRQSQFFGDVQL